MPSGVDLGDVPERLREPVRAALAAAGVGDGHLGVALIDADAIQALNRDHRGRDAPTDVLAFPIDEAGEAVGPRELGDVVICLEHCEDEVEAAVHGVLHLCGYDHEVDEGEMLALQKRVLGALRSQGDLPEADGPLESDSAVLLMDEDAEESRVSVKAGEELPSKAEEDEQSPDAPLGEPSDSAESSLSDGLSVEAPEAAGAGGESSTRTGFVGLAGRPNAGKSTLVNAIVGAHVAIVSMRPQTTRRAIRGVATDPEAAWQLVLIDLPGVQRPRDALTARMQSRVEQELEGADVALLVINGEEGVGGGDRFIAEKMLGARSSVPVICAVNKLDRLSRAQTLEALTAAAELESVDEIFPVSALTGEGVEALVARLVELSPQEPFAYPPGSQSDQPEAIQFAELIREQVLLRTRDELPHAVEVNVTEVIGLEEDRSVESGQDETAGMGVEGRAHDLVTIRAEIWPENDSQKGILIGKSGRKVREIGIAARRTLEAELGTQVHLDLEVRTRKRWRRDEGMLDRLGID